MKDVPHCQRAEKKKQSLIDGSRQACPNSFHLKVFLPFLSTFFFSPVESFFLDVNHF